MMPTLSRAERASVKVPLTYRVRGGAWLYARTINMSASGVLFGPAGLQCGESVEVVFAVPRLVGALAPGRQVCAAEIVRATATGTVAAHFDECRFLLEDEAPLELNLPGSREFSSGSGFRLVPSSRKGN